MEPITGSFVGRTSAQGFATGQTKTFLSGQHLFTAVLNASTAAEIERTHIGDDGKDLNHLAAVVSGITETCAFLEAAINEYFAAITDADPWIKPLDERTLRTTRRFMAVRKNMRYPTLEKYDLALVLADKSELRGRAEDGNVRLLAALRNAIVHYEPRWHSGGGPERFESLIGKFEPSRSFRTRRETPFSQIAASGTAACAGAFKVLWLMQNSFLRNWGSMVRLSGCAHS